MEGGHQPAEEHWHVSVLIGLHTEGSTRFQPKDEKDKEQSHADEEETVQHLLPQRPMEGPMGLGIGEVFLFADGGIEFFNLTPQMAIDDLGDAEIANHAEFPNFVGTDYKKLWEHRFWCTLLPYE